MAQISQIRLFQDWLSRTRGLQFDSFEDLWRWSVTDLDAFWRCIWDYDGLISPTAFETVLAKEQMPGAIWFPGAQVNYARQVFRHAAAAHAAGQPALVAEGERGEVTVVSWPELERQVAALALALRDLGVERGDRVAAYLPNRPETVVAFLACSSIGAIWSVCAPDMGAQAVSDRFAQIEPKVLIAVDGVFYGGRAMDRSETVATLLTALPTVGHLILVESGLATGRLTPSLTFAEATARNDAAVAGFEPEDLPFDHPIWILYSSGTTGLPKAFVHGQGGVLLTAYAVLKHIDIGPSYQANSLDERFHVYSSTGWVMWNFHLYGLLNGTTICLFDGSPSGSKDAPDWGVLWRFSARHDATFTSMGAAFYASCMKSGLRLADCGDLSRLRALGSAGSPLTQEVQAWGSAEFASIGNGDIWWCNFSGGTDLCGNFCTGNRDLPEAPGAMQCRQLGAAVEAWNEFGEAVIDEVGELVCTRPLPGMPLRLWGDEGDVRLLATYFDLYPGVWRHGDWLKIAADGTCIIYGRSDATINRHGVRMGTSEIYSAVEQLAEVADSLVVDLEYLGRESWLALFVVLRPGSVLDVALEDRIRAAIRVALSPRFLPDAILEAPAIPRTLTGKKQEVPIKRLFLGYPADRVINRDAMANPQCLDWYLSRADEITRDTADAGRRVGASDVGE